MKTIILILMATLTATVSADDPESALAVEARAMYDQALQEADVERAATLQSVKDEALKHLEAALKTSLKIKNRKEANTIAAAIKSLKERSVLEEAGLPAVDKLKAGYEASIKAGNSEYDSQILPAKLKYRTALEAASDAAFEEMNLEEVNRIAAVLEQLLVEVSSACFENSLEMSFKPLPGGPVGAFSIGVYEFTQQQYEAVMAPIGVLSRGQTTPLSG